MLDIFEVLLSEITIDKTNKDINYILKRSKRDVKIESKLTYFLRVEFSITIISIYSIKEIVTIVTNDNNIKEIVSIIK